MELLAQLLPLAILIGVFYFIIIRPQQQQAKKHKEMVENLQKGDKIITSGGLYVEVVKAETDYLKVKLNDEGQMVRISKDFVAKKQEESQAE
jgi:preprotein translocase subunit YajC